MTALPVVTVTGVYVRLNLDGIPQPGYALALSCGHEAVIDHVLPEAEEPEIGDQIPCRACGWVAKGVDPKLDPGGEFDDEGEVG